MQLLKAYSVVLGTMSLAGLLLMGVDKLLARWNKRRISEKTLLMVAGFGGALGSWLGMVLFRHKTKHRAFSVGLPLLALLHLAILLGITVLRFKGGLE